MNVHQTPFPLTPTGPHLPALLLQPHNPIALMLFGHGAGTPMRAPLMEQMAVALAHHRIATFRYDYPYSHRLQDRLHRRPHRPVGNPPRHHPRRHPRRPRPRPRPPLLPRRPLHERPGHVPPPRPRASAPRPRPHLLRLPQPLARPPATTPSVHLQHVPVPTLFIQGARDPEYCDLAELKHVVGQLSDRPVRGEPARSLSKGRVEPPIDSTKPHHTLHVIPGADHAFNLPPHAPKTQHHAIQEAAAATATWIQIQLQEPET